MKEEELSEIFEKFGNILAISIIKDKRTNIPKGCAFINFATKEEADLAMNTINSSNQFIGDVNKPLQVKYSDNEIEKMERKLFIGMLGQADESTVTTMFQQFGAIEELTIVREKDGKPKGYGFIKFSTREEAEDAIRELDSKQTLPGSANPIIVKFADTERQKRKKQLMTNQIQQGQWGNNFYQQPSTFNNMEMKNKLLFIYILLAISIASIKADCLGPDSDPTLKKWSDKSIWPGMTLPGNGAMVSIEANMKVLLDISPPPLTRIWIKAGGALVWSSKAPPIELITGGILIEGRMDIGDDRCRFNGLATITLTGIDGQGYYEERYEMARKYIGVLPGGKLELHGALSYPIPTWVRLSYTAQKGDTLLTLDQDVSKWPIGSQIVVGSTDFDYLQSEQNEVAPCSNCAVNQLKLKYPVSHYHFGGIDNGVDMRAEVGLLSKTIKIRGQMQPACNGSALCKFFNFDTFGGHIKIIQGFSGVHIQGAELYHMGQTYNLGYYPIHFHMCADVDTGPYAAWPTFVKDTSIHHTFSRCLTIHGTSGLLVVNNFAYDHIGHCYFFEDSSEQRNYLDSNVGLVTRWGYLLPSDRSEELCLYLNPKDFNGGPTNPTECKAVSTFWVTNPNNILTNNVAGGGVGAGFWYLFPDGPSGLSAPIYPYVKPAFTPLGTFSNNIAHSNVDSGMNVDQGHQIVPSSAANPGQYMGMRIARYKPRVNPLDINSARAPAVFYKFVAYKNKWRGLWARGGDIIFQNSQFSDNAIGATLASEGVMPADPGSTQSFIGCTFVGMSANIGSPSNGVNTYKGHTIPAWQEFTPRGIEFYDGPVTGQWNSYINYNSDGVRNMSAIGWVLYNDWVYNPKSFLEGSNFVNTNSRVLSVPFNVDGTKNQVFLDRDGTLTGTAMASVVPNTPYFYSPRCVVDYQMNMSKCYEKFASLYIYNQDVYNTNIPNGQAGVVMIRDQYSYYRHLLNGVPNSNPRNTFMPLVMIGRTYTMHFTHPSPPKLRLQMTNFDSGDTITVGVCYPKWGVTFKIQRSVVYGWQTFSTDLVMGRSLADINNDPNGNTAFYDSNSGLLFLKFIQKGARPTGQYCPLSGCESIDILATGGSMGTNTGDCTYDAYGTGVYTKREYATRGGCNGSPELTVDKCGICGGNGTLCVGGSKLNSAPSISVGSP
eukprot:gene20701-24863_t